MKIKTHNNLPYPINLWSAIFEREIVPDELPRDWSETLTWALRSMNDSRKSEVLLNYYRDSLTLQQIEEKRGFCRERSRQLINSAIRDLRNPHKRWILLHGLEAASKEGMRLSDTPPGAISCFSPSLSDSTDALNLSARTINCLRQAQIHLIGELVLCSETDLLRIPNFGRACLNETKNHLDQFGYSLYKETRFIVATLQNEVLRLRNTVMEQAAENTRLASLLATTEADLERANLEISHLRKVLTSAASH